MISISKDFSLEIVTDLGKYQVVKLDLNELRVKGVIPRQKVVNIESFLLDNVELPLNQILFPISLNIEEKNIDADTIYWVGKIDNISNINRRFIIDMISEYTER